MAGSKIVSYSPERIRSLAKIAEQQYLRNQTQLLTFEDWKCTAFPVLRDHPELFSVQRVDYSKPIRICKSAKELLAIAAEHQEEFDDIKLNAPDIEKDIKISQLCKKLFTPALVINKPEGFTIPGKKKCKEGTKDVEVPIWFNSTLKGVNLRLGFANMDSATPGAIRLDDNVVHAMLGGQTGSGKSVAINTLACSTFLEYAPWEVEFYMLDMKINELIRYANRVKSPHVSIVGATGSTEFVMSVFDKLRTEMKNRQNLFEIAGVENLKNFREKYNLVLPRIVLLVDEFVQMYDNLKTAEQAGCTDADDQRLAINSAISALARLGRSFGIHMMLSSQQLDGSLDDQTVNQFAAGATLQAPAGISTTLIGNDAGVRITGKGKCIINNNKATKDEANNVYTRVPYIQAGVDPEKEASGEIPYLQALLAELRKQADSVGWDNELYFYNENEIIPYVLFGRDLEAGSEKEQHPNTGDELTDQLFRDEISKVIVMGRQVKYSESSVATIDLKTRRGHSIVVAGTVIQDRVYALRLLAENLKSPSFNHYVIAADRAVTEMSGIQKTLVSHTLIRAKSFPIEIYSTYQLRKKVLDVYTVLQDKNDGQWSAESTLQKLLQDAGTKYDYALLTQLAEIVDSMINMTDEEIADFDLSARLESTSADDYSMGSYLTAIEDAVMLFNTLSSNTDNFTKSFSVKDLSKVFIWMMGLDEMIDVGDYELKLAYQTLFSDGPSYGIHSIITATHWDKAGALIPNVEFILEKCKKSFFLDCDLPVKVNINANSMQLLTRQSKESVILRKYKIS